MSFNKTLFIQIADGIAKQFGENCEVVLYDLTSENIEKSLVYVVNGHVTHRQAGDGPSHVVLEALQNKNGPLDDHLGYLTQTADGRILKSSTIYLKDEDGQAFGILAINYDITGLTMADSALKALIQSEDRPGEPERIPQNINDLLDDLIAQSIKNIGKPVALMTKDDKVEAIRFLNESGAFLVTKSGDKISKYFGISKYTLYSYIDINK